MSLTTLPSFAELAETLSSAHTDIHPSEIHGLFCGQICAISGKIDSLWEKNIFGEKIDPELGSLLHALYDKTFQQLSEFSLEFTLFLPADDISIDDRTEALSLWCQGFLTGLQHFNVPIENRKPSDATEAINDIIEISQVNYGDTEDNEENETAYSDLVEYVRLSALMIFQELQKDSSQQNDDPQQLH